MSAAAVEITSSPTEPAAPTPRRVCLVTETAGAGVGRHFLDLAAGLAARGVEVVAIYSPGRCDVSFRERRAAINGVRFIEFPMRRAVSPLDAADLARLIRCIRAAGPFDLIHGHSSKGGALARLAARWLGVPCIYTPHAFVTLDPTLSPLKRKVYGSIERWLARRTDAIIAVSRDEADHARGLGIDPHRMHVVHNGVDAINFPSRDAVRARLGLSPDEFCVGFVGRLTTQKAPDVLIEAVAALVQQQPSAKLLIVGSGPLEATIREQVKRLGLGSRVQLLGDVVATAVMPAFDVFALSSRYEGLPYVLLETLAGGLPIVATRVGGAAACIDEGENGIVVEPGSTPALTAALAMLATDPSLRQRFAAASKAKAARFSMDRMLDETLSVYCEVAVRRGRGSSN